MTRTTLIFGLLAAAFATQVEAQTISSRAADIRIGGRLQAQYAASSVEAADNDFFFRRVRLIADITVNEFFSGRVQPDFAGGKAVLQDAYVTFSPSSSFDISMGQFKRAFDLFDLSSSTDLSIIERDGRVAGVSSCAGVGGACSLARLSEKLDFAGRDQGIRVEAEGERVSFMATVTNGTGANTSDENDAKSFAGRLTVAATDKVSLGGGLTMHDYVQPDDENGQAVAWTADLEYGTWRDGVHLQLAAMQGDNWKSLDPSGDEATFFAVQGWVSYYAPLSGGRLTGIEPLARVSIADPNGDAVDDGATIFTPGLMLYVGGKNKIGFNVDVFAPQTGDTEYSFKIQSFLYF